MDKITEQMLRMAQLSGNPVDAKTLKPVESDSNGSVELTEQEWKDVPMNQKIVLEGKEHVVAFQNKFVLKPVTIKTDDKGNTKTNKVSDYEKDGGDAEKVNKKMTDNDTDGGTKMVKEERSVGPVSDEQREAGKMVHDHLTHGKKKYGLEKDMTPKEKEDAEYEEMMKKKREKKEPDSFIKSNSLKNATIGETYENKQEFDDKDADEYYGLDRQREDRLTIPKQLTSSINSKIKEIAASIEHYDEKGYNDGDGDNSNKIKAINALEQIKSNLSLRTEEGMKQAQLFFLTLMSPITDLFPADVVNFLAKGSLESGKDSSTLDKVEPFSTSLKETFSGKNYMFTNKSRFDKFFMQEVLPSSGIQDDVPAYNQMYIDYVDSLVRDGQLPANAIDWIPPEIKKFPLRESKEQRKMWDILEERKKAKKDPCWKGYTQLGTKKKNGKDVPNCVKNGTKGVVETVDVTDFNHKSQGGTRKELLTKYTKTKSPEDAVKARKAGASPDELKAAKDA